MDINSCGSWFLFDLPSLTKAEQRANTRFREFLLDQGFEMAQFSVYVRHTHGKEAINVLIRKVSGAVPPEGKVDIIQFTDKQFENMVCLRGPKRKKMQKNPEQLVLF